MSVLHPVAQFIEDDLERCRWQAAAGIVEVVAREWLAPVVEDLHKGAVGQVSADTWCDLHGDGQAMMASWFNGWAGVFHNGTLWHALGQPKARTIRPLAIGTRVQALAAAADDLLHATETGTASIKILHSEPGAGATTADCR